MTEPMNQEESLRSVKTELELREEELSRREEALKQAEAELKEKQDQLEEKIDTRNKFQQKKEGLYDKIPLTLHQVDAIIIICVLLLFAIFVCGGLGIDPLAMLRK